MTAKRAPERSGVGGHWEPDVRCTRPPLRPPAGAYGPASLSGLLLEHAVGGLVLPTRYTHPVPPTLVPYPPGTRLAVTAMHEYTGRGCRGDMYI